MDPLARRSAFHVERVKSINDRFQMIGKIGGGTYGEVQKCRDRDTEEIVAVKRIIILRPEDGFPNTTIREVQLLRELRHDNVILLKYVVQSENESEPGIYLVFDYCEYDLYALLYMPDIPRLEIDLTFSLMKQFLVALHFCAIHRVVHRDLKPANMFITRGGVLKLGDFGLARKIRDRDRLSDKVITLWYRPPELLLGCQKYDTEVDIWSAGCILYEMVTTKVLFQAREPNDAAQLMKIFSVCGIPRQEDWPDFFQFDKAQLYANARELPKEGRLGSLLQENIPKDFFGIGELLLGMLQLNPAKRISAEEALNHPFLRRFPFPPNMAGLPKPMREEMHQMKASNTKKKREKERNERNKGLETNGGDVKPRL
jgi:serine/threonine protein kinase